MGGGRSIEVKQQKAQWFCKMVKSKKQRANDYANEEAVIKVVLFLLLKITTEQPKH